jgi:hypothetical protein
MSVSGLSRGGKRPDALGLIVRGEVDQTAKLASSMQREMRSRRRDLSERSGQENPFIRCACSKITEAFPWNEAPRYLIRDRDQVYGLLRRAD